LIKVIIALCISIYCYAFMIESSYSVAHIKALKEDKLLLVFLTKEGCEYCNNELTKILQNRKIGRAVENKALFVIVTKNQKDSYPIEMLYTTHYPTLFFLDNHELFYCETLEGEIKATKVLDCLE